MKKLFLISAFFAGIFMTQSAYARYDDSYHQDGYSYHGSGSGCPGTYAAQYEGGYHSDYAAGDSYGYDQSACQERPVGECWCKYVSYEPCYYTTKRCVEEVIPCKKKCCRYVPKYYEVQKCRYVPSYYSVTCCKYCPEYYYVEDCKTCKKWVCDQHCKMIPKYYWKHSCTGAVSNTCPAGCY